MAIKQKITAKIIFCSKEYAVVKNPSEIKNAEFDYIVVAVLSDVMSGEILQELINMDVSKQRIICGYKAIELSEGDYLANIELMKSMLYGIESYCQNDFALKNGYNLKYDQMLKKYELIKNLLKPYDLDDGYSFVRIGRNEDGGYLMLNDFSKCGVLYGFGVGDDISFEMSIAERGYQIYLIIRSMMFRKEMNGFTFSKRG